MYKLFWFLIVSLLFGTVGVTATEVFVTSQVENNTVYFDYKINFEDEETTSFAFEKPKNSRFISANSSSGEELKPSVAGDFFIFEPNVTYNQTIDISFESPSLYSDLQNTGTFSTYVTFNIEVDQLEYTHKPGTYANREFFEIFPRDYILQNNGDVEWSITNVSTDQLFLISYEDDQGLTSQNEAIFLFLLFIPIVFFVGLFIFLKISSKKIKDTNKNNEEEKIRESKESQEDDAQQEETSEKDKNSQDDTAENQNKKEENSHDEKQQEEQQTQHTENQKQSAEELFEDFISKYLTENEQEVARIIKEHPGIAQNDILHHTPHLTKSNLSKIIAKLNNKKIFNRIKVGKVNKIYLGERLDFEEKSSSSNHNVE